MKNKKILILISTISLILLGLAVILLFVYPGFLIEKEYVDERTGQKFDIVDGKVQVYLPVKVIRSTDGMVYYEISATYDDNARLVQLDNNGFSSYRSVDQKVFTYDIDGKLSHIIYKNDGGDKFINAMDVDIDYFDDGSIKTINCDNESFGFLGYPNGGNYTFEYNENGLLVNHSYKGSEGIKYRDAYSYNYGNKGNLEEISFSGNAFSYDMDFKYSDGQITESVLEGKREDKYIYDKETINREGGHIVEYHDETEDTRNGISFDNYYMMEYGEDGLSAITEGYDYRADYTDYENRIDISYKDGYIDEIIYTLDPEYQFEYSLTHENGQLTKISRRGDGESFLNSEISFEYQLFEIDKDEWEDYLDNYYIYRYLVMRDCMYKMNFDVFPSDYHFVYPGLFELEEGYFDKFIENRMQVYRFDDGYDIWYELTTLPKLLD